MQLGQVIWRVILNFKHQNLRFMVSRRFRQWSVWCVSLWHVSPVFILRHFSLVLFLSQVEGAGEAVMEKKNSWWSRGSLVGWLHVPRVSVFSSDFLALCTRPCLQAHVSKCTMFDYKSTGLVWKVKLIFDRRLLCPHSSGSSICSTRRHWQVLQ